MNTMTQAAQVIYTGTVAETCKFFENNPNTSLKQLEETFPQMHNYATFLNNSINMIKNPNTSTEKKAELLVIPQLIQRIVKLYDTDSSYQLVVNKILEIEGCKKITESKVLPKLSFAVMYTVRQKLFNK